MQKWEYCAISGLRLAQNFSINHPYLTSFNINNPSGYTSTRLEKTRVEDERMVVAKTIAKLGEDGWELVSATQDS